MTHNVNPRTGENRLWTALEPRIVAAGRRFVAGGLTYPEYLAEIHRCRIALGLDEPTFVRDRREVA
jgi:hypothetical protein